MNVGSNHDSDPNPVIFASAAQQGVTNQRAMSTPVGLAELKLVAIWMHQAAGLCCGGACRSPTLIDEISRFCEIKISQARRQTVTSRALVKHHPTTKAQLAAELPKLENFSFPVRMNY